MSKEWILKCIQVSDSDKISATSRHIKNDIEVLEGIYKNKTKISEEILLQILDGFHPLSGHPYISTVIYEHLKLKFDQKSEDVKGLSFSCFKKYIEALKDIYTSMDNLDMKLVQKKCDISSDEFPILSRHVTDITRFPAVMGSMYLTPSHIIFKSYIVDNITVISLNDADVTVKIVKPSMDHIPLVKSWKFMTHVTSGMAKIGMGYNLEIKWKTGSVLFSFDMSTHDLQQWYSSINELIIANQVSAQLKQSSTNVIDKVVEKTTNTLQNNSYFDFTKCTSHGGNAISFPLLASYNLMRYYALYRLTWKDEPKLLIFTESKRESKCQYKEEHHHHVPCHPLRQFCNPEFFNIPTEDDSDAHETESRSPGTYSRYLHLKCQFLKHHDPSHFLNPSVKTKQRFDISILKDNLTTIIIQLLPLLSFIGTVVKILQWENRQTTLQFLLLNTLMWYCNIVHYIPLLCSLYLTVSICKGLLQRCSPVEIVIGFKYNNKNNEEVSMDNNDNTSEVHDSETNSSTSNNNIVHDISNVMDSLQNLQNAIGDSSNSYGKLVTLHKGSQPLFTLIYLSVIIRFLPPGGPLEDFWNAISISKEW